MKIATALLLFILFSCNTGTEKTRLIGKKQVKGAETIYVSFYQADEADMATALLYEVVNEKNAVLAEKAFLAGTHDRVENTDDFYPQMTDSILYISYPDAEKVYVIKDLKYGQARSREEMFMVLKSSNKDMVEM